MALPYSDKFIPRTRRGAEVLIESANFDIDELTPEQIAACRVIYFFDDDQTVEQRARDDDKGSSLTDGMEDETEAINQFERVES